MVLYTIFFAFVGVVIALLLFIYFNRNLQNKRDARREEMRERKQEFLDRLLEAKKKHHSDTDDEVSDTTKVE